MNKFLDPQFLFKNLVSVEDNDEERTSIPLFQAFINKMYFKNDKPNIPEYISHADVFEFYKNKQTIRLSKVYGYKNWIISKRINNNTYFYNKILKSFEITNCLFSIHYFDLIEALESIADYNE